MKAIFTLILSMISLFAWSQAPSVEWDKTYGTASNENAKTLVKTQDGGYLMGGEFSNSNRDFLIIKVNANGIEEWRNTYDNNGNYDQLNTIAQNIDGGYVLGGYTFSTTDFNYDYWVVKVNANGSIEWTIQLNGNNTDIIEAIQIDQRGDIIIGGYSSSSAGGDKTENSRGSNDLWIVKLNNNGIKIWDKTIGGSSDDLLMSLKVSSNGNYLLGAYSYSGISGEKSEITRGGADFWIVNLSQNGNIIWDKTIGGSYNDILLDLEETTTGDIILAGSTQSLISGDKSQSTIYGQVPYQTCYIESYSCGWGATCTRPVCITSYVYDTDYWVVKLNSSGQKIWDKDFGGTGGCSGSYCIWNDFGNNISFLNNDILIMGHSESNAGFDKSENSRGGFDAWLIKLDNDGNKIWDKTVGGNNTDFLYKESVVVSNNSKVTFLATSFSGISGDKTSPALGGSDYWLVSLVGEPGDEEPPVISGTPTDILAENDPGSCYTSITWAPPTATDNKGVVSFTSNYQPGDLFSYGATQVVYTATDAAGNSTQASFYVYVQDNEAPTFAYIPENIIAEAAAESCSATVELPEIVVLDNCEEYFLFGTRSDGEEIPLTDPYPVGTTTITYEAYDMAENLATLSFTVTVIDTETPTFNSEDLTFEEFVQPGQCHGLVDLPVIDAFDDCGVTLTKSFDWNGNPIPDPGSIFQVGTTIVTYTATDTGGNEAFLTITVVVIDNESPVITQPGPIEVDAEPGACSATLDLFLPITMDNCAISSLTKNHEGDDYPVGETIITWTAVDIHGNTATATQTVVVRDVTPPTIVQSENIVLSGCEPIANWETPVAEDACGSVTIEQTAGPESGSSFEAGTTTTITYTATDVEGNQTSMSFTVTRDPELVVSTSVTNGTCTNGNLGSVTVNVTGGKEPFTYLWNTGATTASLDNLEAGEYSVVVTDANHCSTTTSVSVTTENCIPVLDLNLTSECYEDPAERSWRITNPNEFDVEVTWTVYGSTQTGTLTATPGLTYFTTIAQAGPNTTIIEWLNEKGEPKQVTKASSNKPCCLPSAITERVVDFDQGQRRDGKDIIWYRSNPDKALGKADAKDSPMGGIRFVSLGFGGSITLEFDNQLCDKPGNDLRVYETSYGNPMFALYPEQAEVFVSQDGDTWKSLGRTNTTTPSVNCRVKLDTDFDISGAYSWIKFVRVVDVTNPNAKMLNPAKCTPLPVTVFNKASDGFDLDAIESLENSKPNGWPSGREMADAGESEEVIFIANPSAMIYPNPVERELLIDLEEEEEFVIKEDEAVHLEIMDMKGIRHQSLNHDLDNGLLIRCDVSSLSPGLYLARTQTNGIIRTYKFVKQ